MQNNQISWGPNYMFDSDLSISGISCTSHISVFLFYHHPRNPSLGQRTVQTRFPSRIGPWSLLSHTTPRCTVVRNSNSPHARIAASSPSPSPCRDNLFKFCPSGGMQRMDSASHTHTPLVLRFAPSTSTLLLYACAESSGGWVSPSPWPVCSLHSQNRTIVSFSAPVTITGRKTGTSSENYADNLNTQYERDPRRGSARAYRT